MKIKFFKKLLFSAVVVFSCAIGNAQTDNDVVADSVAVEDIPVLAADPVTTTEAIKVAEPVAEEKKGPDAQQSARTITNQMKDHLILSDTQNLKVYIVNLDFLKKTFENNKNADKAERNKRQRGLEEERDTKLKSVLNEKQFKVFIANRPIDRKRIIPYYVL